MNRITPLLSGKTTASISKRAFASNVQSKESTKTPTNSNTSYENKNLGSILEEQCSKLQHKDALRVPHQNLRWTYTELQNWVDAAANGLIQNQYKKGSKIASFVGNQTESITMNLAGSKVGVEVVNINPQSSMEELGEILKSVQPKGLMLHVNDRIKDPLIALIPELDTNYGEGFKSKQFPFLRQVINTHYHNIVEDATFYREFHIPECVPNYAQKESKSVQSNVTTTSFYDKSNKGGLNQSQLVSAAVALGQKLGFSFSERICNIIPLSSPTGQVITWSSFLNSSFLVLPASQFEVEATLTNIAKELCTCLVGTTEQISEILSSPTLSKFDISSLKKVIVVDANQSNVDKLRSSLKELGIQNLISIGEVDLPTKK